MPLKKFENKIKSRLESREIQPSPGSWKKLNQRLNDSSDYKTTKYHWIAASAAAVGLVSIWLTQDPLVSKSMTENPAVVESQNFAEVDLPPSKQPINLNEVKHTENRTVKRLKNSQSPQIQGLQVLPSLTEETASTEINSNSVEWDTREVLVINQVASGDEVVEDKSSISDEELDELLNRYRNEVRREIIDQKDISQKAKSLLNEVENEMDRSFKKQIFDAFVSGAKAIHTAYINRKN